MQSRIRFILPVFFAIVLGISAYGNMARAELPSPEGKPLKEPLYSANYVGNWAVEAAQQTMTFSYEDYLERFEESKKYFTTTGWDGFAAAMRESRFIETVKKQQVYVALSINTVPIVEKEELVDDVYNWIVTIPVKVFYKVGDRHESETMILALRVVRSKDAANAKGIGIQQWVLHNLSE